VTTSCAGAAGSIGWLALERFRDGHATTLGAASGMVAGLVAITPSGGSLTPLGALVMGAAAGVICALAVGLKYRWRYDDSLDVVGVHLVGGLVGTLGIGILATSAAPTAVDGLLYGGGVEQLGRQLVGALAVMSYAFLASLAIAWVVHRVMGFRIDEEHEVSGIDLVIHAETAYDLHSTAGARSSGGLQIPKATTGPFAGGHAQRSTDRDID
jgi:Amt family ammonium transporter